MTNFQWPMMESAHRDSQELGPSLQRPLMFRFVVSPSACAQVPEGLSKNFAEWSFLRLFDCK